jgi:hypothetical protein
MTPVGWKKMVGMGRRTTGLYGCMKWAFTAFYFDTLYIDIYIRAEQW